MYEGSGSVFLCMLIQHQVLQGHDLSLGLPDTTKTKINETKGFIYLY